MQGRFAYEVLSKYPHFNPADAVIWTRFILAYPDFGDSVNYDVCCGSGPDLPDSIKPEWAANAQYLGRYKIDAVVYRGSVHYVIEVKPNAGLGALGQIISYAILYDAFDESEEKVVPVLITNFERPDIRKIAARHGIEYYIV